MTAADPKGRTKAVVVRMTEKEHRRITRAAAKAGLSLSQYFVRASESFEIVRASDVESRTG